MFKSAHMLALTLAGILAGAAYWDAGVGWWSLSGLVYFAFSCLGVTVTFHRFLAHRSFRWRSKWLFRVFALLGTLAGTGSAIAWVAVHKEHHAHSDGEGDPHGPHLGWRHFVPDYDGHVNYMKVRSLMADPYLSFLRRHSAHIIALYLVALFVLGGDQLLAFAGLIPMALTSIFSVLCNFFPHMTGYRNFDTGDHSYNTWWLALPTWGDAWHNNHHARPWLPSFQHRWWEIDISGLVIKLVAEPQH